MAKLGHCDKQVLAKVDASRLPTASPASRSILVKKPWSASTRKRNGI